MEKKEELLAFLQENIFDPIQNSPTSSIILKQGIRLIIMRMKNKDPQGIIDFYRSKVIGSEKITKFAEQMKAEGFTRFEEIADEFQKRFNEKWLRGD